nr:involucrin-like [Arachis hypogaea]
MVHTSLAQQLRRPHIGRHRAQEEVHQEEYHQEYYQQEEQHNPANLNMSHILHAIEDLEMKHMEGQKQILAMQSKWMKQQEEWQKQHMEQQQEQYSQLTQALHQVTERQERQDKHLQELNQWQLAQMKSFNEFSVLNEGRQLHREEFSVNTQARLSYMSDNMHHLHYAIPTYEEVQKEFVEREEGKVKPQKETLKKKNGRCGLLEETTWKKQREWEHKHSRKAPRGQAWRGA